MAYQERQTYTYPYLDRMGLLKKAIVAGLVCIAIVLEFAYPAQADTLLAKATLPNAPATNTGLQFKLHKGPIADYGASPWYIEGIKAGENPINVNFDSGSNFWWATSDLCNTDACNAHQKVNTSQPNFEWIDQDTTVRSFGPWGSMETWTGQVPFNDDTQDISLDSPFFAAVKYTGNQFKYLWDGGIGFPSRSDEVESGSGFFFGELYQSGAFEKPTFSVVTHPDRGVGYFFLGEDDDSQYQQDTEIELQPDTSGEIDYLWGTTLYSAKLGETPLLSLAHQLFYLDSGSSVFKGDERYITPILQLLYEMEDSSGNPIFDKVFDEVDGNRIWVGLVYNYGKSPEDYPDILPNFTLTMGQSCQGEAGKAAEISLSPKQYSYKVDVGDRTGEWVVAFQRLDGVGGLLVGSTFMDLLYAKHIYNVDTGALTQGNMYLYQKTDGDGPQGLTCVPNSGISSLSQEISVPNPGISGTWYNSYCSRVDLDVDSLGNITGVYTSHTGSTGSSNVVGWVGNNAQSNLDSPINPDGTPIALGIQWRLINQDISDADGSWHWVSNFSGQYHPEQTVSQQSQDNYVLSETLEILNSLLATAKVEGLADTVPQMWPQTLDFHKNSPDYCQSVTPEEPVPFTATATDNVTGTWKLDGNTLSLEADIDNGTVSGTYVEDGKTYTVTGLVDPIQGDLPDVVQQGIALTMSSQDNDGKVLAMAGGVDLSDTNKTILWKYDLESTTWTDRYKQLVLYKTTWTKE